MRLHYLQHVPFETPGRILAWAESRRAVVSATLLYAGAALPDPAVPDFVVVMGGPMGVHDERAFPWLAAEKRWLEAVIARGTRVLGVCLGAQLLAEVLGASVASQGQREIGWFDVTTTAEAAQAAPWRGMPARFTAFHWHGDRFAIPAGAIRLAQSAGCDNQAFLFGGHVLGLQFHLECDAAGGEALLRECAADLEPGDFVQDAARIRAGFAGAAAMHGLLARLLDDFVA